ncbi:MAG: hypothetical protein RLP09_30095 [Sandaracinaceae bacterium]
MEQALCAQHARVVFAQAARARRSPRRLASKAKGFAVTVLAGVGVDVGVEFVKIIAGLLGGDLMVNLRTDARPRIIEVDGELGERAWDAVVDASSGLDEHALGVCLRAEFSAAGVLSSGTEVQTMVERQVSGDGEDGPGSA